MRIGNREFDLNNKCYIMGILNVTPDSFSDGGKFRELDKALFQVEKMLAEGMDVLDIGGESTRPGHEKISDEEEMERVLPVLEKVRAGFDVPISLDTYKPAVAKAGILAGADLINDIRGLKYDIRMAEVIAEAGVCCCLMHNRKESLYRNLMEELKSDLQETLALARAGGISDEKIILDPGVGFGKTYEHNLEVICKLNELKSLGFPILLGASRKSVIGLTLNLPVTERMEGTLATTLQAVMSGCAFVRVHDIRENKRAIQMAEAIREGWKQVEK